MGQNSHCGSTSTCITPSFTEKRGEAGLPVDSGKMFHLPELCHIATSSSRDASKAHSWFLQLLFQGQAREKDI